MRTNKKLWIIYIGIFVAVTVSAVSVLTLGSHYTFHTGILLPAEQPPMTEVMIENKGIVEAENIRMENGEMVIDFKALSQGKTDFSVRYLFGEDGEMITRSNYHLEVKLFQIIMEHSQGILNFNGYLIVVIAFVSVLFLVMGVMLWSLSDYRRYGEFGYKMIVCGGVGIYTGVLWLFLVYKLLNHWVKHFGHFMQEIADTGSIVMLVLTPVMMVLSILLSLSNIQLIRKEGRRPVNALGIVFGIVWLFSTIVIFEFDRSYISWLWSFPNGWVVRSAVIYVIVYFECMFISTIVCAFLSTKFLPPHDRDYIIILGCGINRDGTLTPLLKGRVDSAIRFEKAQFEKNGKHACFVPSGGQGADEVISECEAMSRYLQSQGIPEERILKEDKSTNTFENMRFSKDVIEKDCGDITKKKVAFATTNYHILRGYILAEKNGFDAKGISAKTKMYFYPNAFLREFIGLLADQKWKHLATILLICALSVGYTMLK
ncbi:MAG: YdcF family protein [Ruminococcus sp.]|nr:YdcF family protein [Ruminococcus sp.]